MTRREDHDQQPGDHHEIHGRRDTSAERHLAATLAVQMWHGRVIEDAFPDDTIRRSANAMYRFLTGAVRLHISRGPVRDQNTGEITHHHTREHYVATVLTDTQKVTFSVAETDAKGNPTTADQISWSLDNSAVGTITPSADTMSCDFVATGVGTVNLIAADANDSNVSGIEAIQVTGGPATAIVITAGTPTAQ